MTSSSSPERRDSTFSFTMRKISDSLKWPHIKHKSIAEKEIPRFSSLSTNEGEVQRVQLSLAEAQRRSSHTNEAVGSEQQYWDPESLRKVTDDQVFFDPERAAEVFGTDHSSRGPFELEDTQKPADLPVGPHEHGQSCPPRQSTIGLEAILNNASKEDKLMPRPNFNRQPTPIPQPFYQAGVTTSRSSSSSSSSRSDALTITATNQSTMTPYSSISSAPPQFLEKCYKRNSFHAPDAVTAVPEIKRQASARLAKGLVPSKDLDSWSWLWDEAFDAKNKIDPDSGRWDSNSRRRGLEYQVQHKCGDGSGLVTTVLPNGTIVSSSLSPNNNGGITEEEKRQTDAAAGRRKSFVERWVLGDDETPQPGPLLPNITYSDFSEPVIAPTDSTSPVSSPPSLTSSPTVETPFSSAATSPDPLSGDAADIDLDLADTGHVISLEEAGLSSFADCVSAIQVAPPRKRVAASSFASASSSNLKSPCSTSSTPRSASPGHIVPAKDVPGEAWDRRDVCQGHKNCHSLHRRYVRAGSPEHVTLDSESKTNKKSGFGKRVESLLRH
ncbi:hypothetical protein BDV97DRAFT_227969 [Delphinella strobiligena]|nr:hypothetical protein BDV97DRAFT_227969 [Delphinella strobiligena]